jgi:hypothetical protein
LGADDICTGGARFDNMLRMADEIHVKDSVCVKLLNNMLRRHAHG